MKNWTIGKRISFGFSVILAILVALSIFVHTSLRVVNQRTMTVTSESMPSLALLAGIKEGSIDILGNTYKHIGALSPAEMQQIEAHMNGDVEQIDKNFAELQKLTTPQTTPLLDDAKSQYDKYRAQREQILDASRAATNSSASAKVFERARAELDPFADSYLASLTKCEDQVKSEANQSAESVLTSVRTTSASLLLTVIIALIGGCALAFYIIRGTTRILSALSTTLSDGATQVASAATQVSSTSQSLAEGSSEQAASVEETSSSLEEMSSITKRNAESAEKANALAKEARTAAERGSSDMKTMSTSMQSIKESSDDISKIIRTIDEIAFQTNILALNAAVEAARAGDAGMGFAVVADEVRSLAQRSAQAAKETGAKIEGAIGNITQGVEISSKVAEALNDIVNKARQVDQLVTEVAGASREQTVGINQINTAVTQMNQVTQGNASNAEESAAAAEELSAQAETMKQAVGDLVRLVSGSSPQGQQKRSIRHELAFSPVETPAIQPKAPVESRGASRSSKPAKMTAMEPALAGARQEIPMDGDFTAF